mgnify:CR=1 FL=1
MRIIMRSAWLLLAAALALAACGATTATNAPATTSVAQIGVADLKAQLDRGERMLLLDVRSAEEYANDGHVASSTLIPLPELAGRLSELPADTPIVCICRSGNRSATACDLLARQGFAKLSNVQGGMTAWAKAGFPVVKG